MATLADLEARQTQLERRMTALPSTAQIDELRLLVTDYRASMQSLVAELSARIETLEAENADIKRRLNDGGI